MRRDCSSSPSATRTRSSSASTSCSTASKEMCQRRATPSRSARPTWCAREGRHYRHLRPDGPLRPAGGRRAGEEKIDCEVIDLRTTSPMDEATILSRRRRRGGSCRGRGEPALLAGHRCRRAGGAESLRVDEGARRDGDRAATCPCPSATRSRTSTSQPRQDRRRRRTRCKLRVRIHAAIHSITVPKWGLSMEKGRLTAWHRQVGDRISSGDEICDIETDKISGGLE